MGAGRLQLQLLPSPCAFGARAFACMHVELTRLWLVRRSHVRNSKAMTSSQWEAIPLISLHLFACHHMPTRVDVAGMISSEYLGLILLVIYCMHVLINSAMQPRIYDGESYQARCAWRLSPQSRSFHTHTRMDPPPGGC